MYLLSKTNGTVVWRPLQLGPTYFSRPRLMARRGGTFAPTVRLWGEVSVAEVTGGALGGVAGVGVDTGRH